MPAPILFTRVIYALHSGDFDFRYVGATTRSPRRRTIEHAYEARSSRRGNYAHWDWMRENDGNIYHFVLENDLPAGLLDEREEFWISDLKHRGYSLLNKTPGGHKVLSGTDSPRYGVPLPDSVKEKIRIKNSGENQWTYGKKLTPEHRAKIARPGTQSVSAKFSADQVRKMRKLYQEGVSLKELSNKYGSTASNIGKIVRFISYKDVL